MYVTNKLRRPGVLHLGIEDWVGLQSRSGDDDKEKYL
jgi:hypothetical protein